LRERPVRLVLDIGEDTAAKPGSVRRVGEQLGINPEDPSWLGEPGRNRRRGSGRDPHIPDSTGRFGSAGPGRHGVMKVHRINDVLDRPCFIDRRFPAAARIHRCFTD
jgi:hypothetical protein